MLIRVIDINAIAPRALLKHDPPPLEHRRIRLPTPVLGKEPMRNVTQLQPSTRLQMPHASLQEPRPIADAVDEHAAVDQIEGLLFLGKRPVALGVCDREAAIWRRRLWLGEGDVQTEYVGIWMLDCECDGPDACAAANVNDARVGRRG